jgi:hypothetical protein
MTAPTKKSPFPDHVKIGSVIYTVHLLSDDNTEYFGRTLQFAQRIYLNPQMSADMAVDTLLHEITHAIWSVVGLESRATEERVAATVGTWMHMVLRDNPDVLDFVQNARGRWVQTLAKDPDEDAER